MHKYENISEWHKQIVREEMGSMYWSSDNDLRYKTYKSFWVQREIVRENWNKFILELWNALKIEIIINVLSNYLKRIKK